MLFDLTSNVTDMSYMFWGAANANPDVSKWNTSNVTDMSGMFDNATNANPDVSKWDTSKVKTVPAAGRASMSIPLQALVSISRGEDVKTIVAGKNGEYVPINYYDVKDPEALIKKADEAIRGDAS